MTHATVAHVWVKCDPFAMTFQGCIVFVHVASLCQLEGPIPSLPLCRLFSFDPFRIMVCALWPEAGHGIALFWAAAVLQSCTWGKEATRLLPHSRFLLQVWILPAPRLSTPTTRASSPETTPSSWTSCTPTPGAPRTAASASRDPWATLTFTPTGALSSRAATSRTHCWDWR